MRSTLNCAKVSEETKTWLERRARNMGSASSVASRLLEESKRRETFRGVEFRDTPEGRFAFVSESRIAVHFLKRAAADFGGDLEKLSAHFVFPVWKVESALAYASAYPEEMAKELILMDELDDFAALKAKLPGLELAASE